MGTPIPDQPPGSDVLLEIDVQGAEQVVAKRPDATVILLLPPSLEVQAQRLAARGDDQAHIERRVEKGVEEVERGRQLAQFTVVNDDLGQTLEELTAIVDRTRLAASRAATPEET
jgi:guanylate kinase